MSVLIGLIIIILSYLLGSIPFGLILVRYAGLGDIRSIGSGNIGATNVARTGNKKLAIATLLLDAAKGAVAVIIAKLCSGEFVAMMAGIAAVAGHIFPVWLKYKGGKGVATTLAVYAAFYWPIALLVCLVWLAVFFISRISSLSAILALFASIIFAFFLSDFYGFILALVLSVLVIYRHHENIKRILRGEELAFAEKK